MDKSWKVRTKWNNMDKSWTIWTKFGKIDKIVRDNIDKIDKSWKVGQIIDRIGQYVYQF